MNKTNCRSDGCSKRLSGRRVEVGLCLSHDPTTRICAFDGCSKQLRSDNTCGNCQKHRYDSLEFKEYYAQYYEDNKDRIIEANKQWADENYEKRQQTSRQWALDNPERTRELRRKRENVRRARKREAFVEVVDPTNLWRRDSGLCFLCGLPCDKEKWELAHIIPLSRGGEHSYMNTAVSHPYCNRKQLGRIIDEEFDPETLWEEFLEV